MRALLTIAPRSRGSRSRTEESALGPIGHLPFSPDRASTACRSEEPNIGLARVRRVMASAPSQGDSKASRPLGSRTPARST